MVVNVRGDKQQLTVNVGFRGNVGLRETRSCLNAVSIVVGSYFSRSGVHNIGTFYDSNKSE